MGVFLLFDGGIQNHTEDRKEGSGVAGLTQESKI